MKTKILLSVIVLGSALATVGVDANAKGCLKGAAVGGLGGYVAGHHAVLGAIGGCLVGRHMANKKDKEAAEAAAAAKHHAPNEPAPAPRPGSV
jgi:hypothetical protein